MPVTTVPTNLTQKTWLKKYTTEYIRDAGFGPYTGKTQNASIQLVSDLESGGGNQVLVPFVHRATNTGETGDNTLEGNEIPLDTDGHTITCDQLRNAVAVGDHEQTKTDIDLLQAGEQVMKDWAEERFDHDIIQAGQSPNVNGYTAYASTLAADRNAWVVANVDRVLFGAAISNYSAVHATGLLNIDAAGDVLTPGMISLAKRMACLASPRIRPIKVSGKGEFFVLMVPTYAFRDLKNNVTMAAAHADAAERGRDNPLFNDGDLYWDGVIIHRVDAIPTIASAGAAGIDVASCFLWGAQAIGVAWKRMAHVIKNTSDYGNLNGIGVAEDRGIDKLMEEATGKQHGQLTLYCANVADT